MSESAIVGVAVGEFVGETVGTPVGAGVGCSVATVGAGVGAETGDAVGGGVSDTSASSTVNWMVSSAPPVLPPMKTILYSPPAIGHVDCPAICTALPNSTEFSTPTGAAVLQS